MKSILLTIFAVLTIVSNANADFQHPGTFGSDINDNFNAFTEDLFVKVEVAHRINEKTRSFFGFKSSDLSKEKNDQEITISTGMEFLVSAKNHFYSNFSVGYRHNGSFNAGIFDGQLIYKKRRWSFTVGGYFGAGRDQTSFKNFYVTVDQQNGAGPKTIKFTIDNHPTVFVGGFEVGCNYILTKRWTLGLKAQLDSRQYLINPKFNRNEIQTIYPDSALMLLQGENATDSIDTLNTVFSLTYSF